MILTEGRHLKVMRAWIQHRASNGEGVKWGSYDYLKLVGVTVVDLEELAEDIKQVVLSEVREKKRKRVLR